jgi:type II secretory pathway component PulM
MIQITARERLLSIGLTAVLAAGAVWAMAVRPARERIRTLERVIPERQAQVHELADRAAEYIALRDQFQELRAKMDSQDPGFELLPFLEAMIERHKLAGHVTTMQQNLLQPRPDHSEIVVTIELQDIALRQLVQFLAAVETADAVIQVGSLHVRRDATNEALVDSTIGIYSPRPATPRPHLAQSP